MHAKTLLASDDSAAREDARTKPRSDRSPAASRSMIHPNANSSDPDPRRHPKSHRNARPHANQHERRTRTRHQPAKTTMRCVIRNRIGSRARSAPAWPPHPISRCSRVGRSPSFATRIIHATMIFRRSFRSREAQGLVVRVHPDAHAKPVHPGMVTMRGT